MYNPFEGLRPSLGPFASVLDSKIAMALALIWALGFVYVAGHLIIGLAKVAKARHGHRAADYEEAKGDLVAPAAALVLLGAVPAIYAALV